MTNTEPREENTLQTLKSAGVCLVAYDVGVYRQAAETGQYTFLFNV